MQHCRMYKHAKQLLIKSHRSDQLDCTPFIINTLNVISYLKDFANNKIHCGADLQLHK